jgi:biopolymer transport protein ExbB
MTPRYLQDYLGDGGPVLWLLLVLGVVLWTLIMLRWSYLTRWSLPSGSLRSGDHAGESSRSLRSGDHAGESGRLALSWSLFAHDAASVRLGWGARWIRTLVVVAPLLGLLGTVSGMVETFSALAGDPDAGASVAGGISEALVTTQFGLILAIPGTLVGRWLDRQADRILQRIRAQASEAA